LTSLANVRPESERIEFLLRRDGCEATRKWVERTIAPYRAEIGPRGSYTTDATYRPRFEKAIGEFEEWLGSTPKERARAMQEGASPPA
jgi:hypothetical protein